MSTSNGEDSARDATDELPSISEPPSDDNDDGEQKTMSTTKDRAQNDPDLECCICLENLSKDPKNSLPNISQKNKYLYPNIINKFFYYSRSH